MLQVTFGASGFHRIPRIHRICSFSKSKSCLLHSVSCDSLRCSWKSKRQCWQCLQGTDLPMCLAAQPCFYTNRSPHCRRCHTRMSMGAIFKRLRTLGGVQGMRRWQPGWALCGCSPRHCIRSSSTPRPWSRSRGCGGGCGRGGRLVGAAAGCALSQKLVDLFSVVRADVRLRSAADLPVYDALPCTTNTIRFSSPCQYQARFIC